MVELFLSFLGRYARMFIDWYVENTLVLSSLVVVYGLGVVLARNNLRKIEERLERMLGTRGVRQTAERLREKPLDESQVEALRAGLLLPIVSSPGGLFFRFVSAKSLPAIFAVYLK